MHRQLNPVGLIISSPLILVLTLAAIGQFDWNASAQAPPVCGDETMEQQTRSAMYVGLDNAFVTHTSGLYAIWLKDIRGGQPRAKAGIDNAIAVYLRAYKSVEAWKLNRC